MFNVKLILDSLQKSTLTSVHSEVMGMLASFEADALPVVVRFLLQTGEPTKSSHLLLTSLPSPSVPIDVIDKVINAMRREMDFESLAKSRVADAAKEGNRNVDGESLTLESIRYGLRFQSRIAEAWLKIIQITAGPADHCPLDIFVLLMLHDIAGFKVGQLYSQILVSLTHINSETN